MAKVKEFDLTIASPDASGVVDATLTSPHLDRALHPDGVAALRIDVASGRLRNKKSRGITLTGFHLRSIEAYVRAQTTLRKVLEPQLKRDRVQWTKGSPSGPTPSNVWKQVKSVSVDVRGRQVAAPEIVAELKRVLRGKALKDELAAYDDAGTESFFVLVLECEWDDEHHVTLAFRNGQFAAIDHE